MKTQIFRLDQYDDILSARDQIGWSRTSRICIVLPRKKRLHLSMLDFVLLAREANRIGVQAAFIVQEASLRYGMEQLGLLCFSSVRQANRANWRTTRRMKLPDADVLQTSKQPAIRPVKPSTSSPGKGGGSRRVQAVFFSAALLALVMLGTLLVPQAQIFIDPLPTDQIYQFTLQGDALHATAPLSGLIHASRLEFLLTDEITIQATGEGIFGDQFATGEVLLTNLTGQDLVIPKGLILQTEGEEPVQFHTVEAVTLPAQPSEPRRAAVWADLPGAAGNVPSGSIRVVAGEIGLSLRVENPLPVSGGTDVRVRTLSAEDVKLARAALLEAMDRQAPEQAGEQIQQSQLLMAKSIRRSDILSEEISTPIGMPCQKAVLTLQALYSAWMVQEDDLLRVSTMMLDTLLPENSRVENRTLQFQFSDPYVQNANGFSQPVEISRRIVRSYSAEDIVETLAGQRTKQLSGILDEYFDGAPVIQVLLTPDWWPVMPFFRFQYKMIQP